MSKRLLERGKRMVLTSSVIITKMLEYGVLGVIGLLFFKQQDKNATIIQEEYRKLVDNLIQMQNDTLKELSLSVNKLSDLIEYNEKRKAETFHKEKRDGSCW